MSETARYELRRDSLMGTYLVQRIEVIGTFNTRAEAFQFMVDRERAKPRAAGREEDQVKEPE